MKKHALLAPGLLAAALLLGGCGDTEDAAETSEAAERAIPVAVRTLHSGEAQSVIRAWAAVDPILEARLLAGVSGTVIATHVTLGDRVREGQLLMEIDPDLFRAQAEEARVRVESAKLAVGKTQKDLDRNQKLFDQGEIVSETTVEAARVEAIKARAEQAAANTAAARAHIALRDARPTAPFTGYVATDPPDPGDSVIGGSLLVHVVALDRVLVRAEVSEQDLAAISVGSIARVSVQGMSESFPGTVTAIGPRANDESRQFPVRIEVVNPKDLPLKAGMVARVEIVREHWDNVALLPVDALVETETRSGFYVIEDNHAVWRDAITGGRQGQDLILLEGAAPGEQVVILGQTRLADGVAVEIEEEP